MTEMHFGFFRNAERETEDSERGTGKVPPIARILHTTGNLQTKQLERAVGLSPRERGRYHPNCL